MAFRIAVLTCLLALACAAPQASVRVPSLTPTLGVRVPFLGGRVVGGTDAEEAEFPHQVSLQWGNYASFEHFCGGSILNEYWVLTAGHCVKAVRPYGIFIIMAGRHNIEMEHEPNEQLIEVESSHVHKLYLAANKEVAPYDIALLKLKKPLQFNKRVQPIALPELGLEPSGDVTVSGWGSISLTSSPSYPSILQKITIPMLDRKTCNASVVALSNGRPSPLHETNICTGPLTGGEGACKGDSGGPLISTKANGDRELVGVVSWGYVPCGSVGAPSVFVKVSNFIDWIASVIDVNSA